MVGPIVEKLAEEYEGRVVIGKCDVDENSAAAAKFGVRNIPTIVFLKGGQIVDKQIGYAPKEALEEKVKKLL